MDYARRVINELLLESVNQDKVIDAIKKRYECLINYKADDDPKGSGKRLVQPVAYGKTSAGNLVFRAFQPYGDTKTKTPHWKLFRLDRVESWDNLHKRRKFSEPPSAQFSAEGKFNETGDKTMSEVYLVADFKGAEQRYNRGGLKKYNDNRANAKKEEDPFYQIRKNIQNKVMATPDVMKNIKYSERQKELKNSLNNSNLKSIYDMSKITDFGDKNASQTVGPVAKDDNTVNDTNTEVRYDNAMKNGPVYKATQNLQTSQDNTLNYNGTENNKEEENNIENK